MKQNQSGFSAVVVLLLILVVAVIGFGGWYVWHANQTDKETTTKTTNITNTTSTPSSSTDDVAKTAYLTIDTGSVRLPLTSELSGLSAGTAEASGYSATDKSVAVLAPELDADWTCVADSHGSKGTIGSISITKDAQRAGPGTPAVTKKVGVYTYGFEPGGSNCTKSAKYSELVSAFKTQFSSLESY